MSQRPGSEPNPLPVCVSSKQIHDPDPEVHAEVDDVMQDAAVIKEAERLEGVEAGPFSRSRVSTPPPEWGGGSL